jgi:hypothetical protein
MSLFTDSVNQSSFSGSKATEFASPHNQNLRIYLISRLTAEFWANSNRVMKSTTYGFETGLFLRESGRKSR